MLTESDSDDEALDHQDEATAEPKNGGKEGGAKLARQCTLVQKMETMSTGVGIYVQSFDSIALPDTLPDTTKEASLRKRRFLLQSQDSIFLPEPDAFEDEEDRLVGERTSSTCRCGDSELL